MCVIGLIYYLRIVQGSKWLIFFVAFQVESRYFYKIPGDWPRMGQNEESPEKIHKVLDDNVEQISTVSIEIFIMHAA